MSTSNAAEHERLAEASRPTRSSTRTRHSDPAASEPPDETAGRRFQAVAWEEPPDPSEGDLPSATSAEVDSPEGMLEAGERFERVPWHPSEVDERGGEGSSEWAEEMKVKNFFDGLG